MKIWIDLSNSPHSLLFPPIARRLEELGHEVLVTARDNAQTVALARPRFPELTVIGGESPGGAARKAGALVGRIGALARWARTTRPEIALSHNSYAQVVAARLLRIPSVTAMDFEHQPANHVAFRLASRVLLPEAMRSLDLRRFGLRARRTRFYPGLKEEIYLADFVPDSVDLDELGIEQHAGDVLVVCRTPPSLAMYHRFANELFGEVVRLVAGAPRTSVIVLARHPEQRAALRALALPRLVVPEAVVEARGLMRAADLFIGAGGTMTREAALLGVPTYSVFAGKRPAVDRWLEERCLLRRLERAEEILPLASRSTEPVPLSELEARGKYLTAWFVDNTVAVGEKGDGYVRTSKGS